MNALCYPSQYGDPCLTPGFQVMGPYMKSPTLNDIGNCTWTLLHTAVAAYNPQTMGERERMRQFIESLSYVFPCKHCGNDDQLDMIAFPLTDADLRSAETLRLWMFEKHNRINRKLKKPEFPKQMVGRRWGGFTD